MTVRSRRAGISPDEAKARPIYARVLGLQYLRPGGLLCFLFFEGAIALGTLLALAELVNWWAVVVLPVSVAAMVKLNDVVAGAIAFPVRARRSRRPNRTVPSRPAMAGTAPASSLPLRAARVPETGSTYTSASRQDVDDDSSATPVSPAPDWVGSPEQRARQSARGRYE